MSAFIPGLGIVKGMGLTLKRFFEPKATIRYPEEPADGAVKFRGRPQLLYDEYGAASYYSQFRFKAPDATTQAAALTSRRPPDSAFLDRLGASLGGRPGGDA